MNPRTEEAISKVILWIIGLTMVIILAFIIGKILMEGVGQITMEFLLESPRRMGKEGGIYSSIISTFYLIALALVMAFPIGVGAAVFLAEYQKSGKLLRLIRFATESLAGIPSIVFGLFGFTFFVVMLGMGWSILSGGLTLTMMVLPTLVRTSEEAIEAVSYSYREASLGLGATKWQTVVRVVLPSALPGIITGVILSTGRAVGESAALILTAGSALGIPGSIFDPGRSLAVHLYVLAVEGISMERAYGTAAVLVIMVIFINIGVNIFSNRQRSKMQ